MNRKLMKHFSAIIILLLFLSAIVSAESKEEKEELYYGILAGSYDVIGRYPDSSLTYTGKIILKNSGEVFEVIRNINDKTIKGTGKIETASADRTKVLRVRFTENNKAYEATYIIGMDLDNYGRLTGYIYLKDGDTKQAGLEALFSDHVYNK
ncbi:MAG: hypothetical protein AB1499_12700 [Nitrospirota bacterium]